jgi:hypothetical protein
VRPADAESRVRDYVLFVAVFGYLLWFRTAGLADGFWIHADQIRDWQIALRHFHDLPLVGPPSLAGGNTAGPSYYWLLWLIATIVGPFVRDLPHAGGFGVAALQSGADAWLYLALARRLRSPWVAAGVVLVVATAAPDVAVSSTIWNPPVAVALAKGGMALALMIGVTTPGALAGVTAMLWLAVQAHTTALPVALAVIGYGLAARGNGWTAHAFARRAGAAALTIAVLQIPWVIHRTTVSAAPASTPMGDSIAAVVRDPLGALRPLESLRALSRAIHAVTDVGLPEGLLASVIVAGAVLLLWRSRDGLLNAIAIGPLVAAAALFSVWQGSLSENYWYLAVAVPAALCALSWAALFEVRVGPGLALVLLTLVVSRQIRQAESTERPLRTPIYGALVRSAGAIAASGLAIREIRTTFTVPEGTDPAYIYSLLGGRLDGTASTRAIVADNGRVEFESID